MYIYFNFEVNIMFNGKNINCSISNIQNSIKMLNIIIVFYYCFGVINYCNEGGKMR